MEKVIGIDLGTTNSCVAIVENDEPKVIPNKGSYDITPSVVAIVETGRRLVGHMAKRQAVTNSSNTAYAFKRLIGRKWDSEEIKNIITTLPYKIVPGPSGDVRILLKNETFTVAELSAFILKEMKEVAEDYLNEKINKAIVTVPAYFSDSQRQATKNAGKIAGLDVIRIINEPTAAALSYGFAKNVDQRIAIYDLGGGTFDISVLDIGNGVYQVLATAGDSLLGGEDFDRRIIDWLVFNFAKEHHLDLRKDKMAMQRLKDIAEKTKCELSNLNEVEINLPFIISTGKSDPIHLNTVLTKEKLEKLTVDLVQRTIRICKESLQKSNIPLDSIDSIILAGGMTRMPLIQKSVSEFFGKEPNKGVHPDEVVALGAAIQGNALISAESNLQNEILLLDVTSHSLGIKVAGGMMYKIIESNTTIPTSQTEIFSTTKENQKYVDIFVYQGESDIADKNELLGKFTLTGLRSAPKGEVDIEVTFDIDANGIVKVSAKDLETEKAQSITISSTSNLSKNELDSMVKHYNNDDTEQNAFSKSNTDLTTTETSDVKKNDKNLENIFLEENNDLMADMLPLIDSNEDITKPFEPETYSLNSQQDEFGNIQTMGDNYHSFDNKQDVEFSSINNSIKFNATVKLNKESLTSINRPSLSLVDNDFQIKQQDNPSITEDFNTSNFEESKERQILRNKRAELQILYDKLKDKLQKTNYGPDALKKAETNLQKAEQYLSDDQIATKTINLFNHEIDRILNMFKNIVKFFS